MGYVLIAPEMVILWAARQHFGAKHFAKKHQRHGWTMTHAFFLIMGGFTLHDERGTALRILEPIELESLSEAGKIAWPSISEEEIQDRSKGDYLSKAIVLVQASWFIAQCIVRAAHRLEITELEVATVAYAVLTGVTYYLWWKKPLDVRCSIPVYLLKDDEKEDVNLQGISSVSPVSDPDPVAVSPLISCNLNSNHVNSQSPPISEETRIPQQTLIVMSSPARNYQEPHKSESAHDDPTGTPEPQSIGTWQWHSQAVFIQRQTQKYGIVLGFAYAFVRLAWSGLRFACRFLLYQLGLFFGGFAEMLASERLNDSMPLRVPTFYSPKFTNYDPRDPSVAVVVAFCTAIIFGAIHGIAWSFHFPSLQERLAWRISAASIAGLPILLFVFIWQINILDNHFEGWWGTAVIVSISFFGFPVLYVIARIVLLVLHCIALRALPPTALVEIRWAGFSPHIG
jgi:hypothetical protein